MFSSYKLLGPAAFRPRAHVATTYTSSIEKGRPVLQGLLAIDYLTKEVSFSFNNNVNTIRQVLFYFFTFLYFTQDDMLPGLVSLGIWTLFHGPWLTFSFIWLLENMVVYFSLWNFLHQIYCRCLAGHKQCPNLLMILWSMCKLFWRGLMKDAGLHTWRYFFFWMKLPVIFIYFFHGKISNNLEKNREHRLLNPQATWQSHIFETTNG